MNTEIALSASQQNSNILRLATAQALAGANSVVFYTTGAIVGNAIAPDSTLATLPITVFVLGMAACILPFGALAKKQGRKAVFMAGTGAGIATGLTAALAVVIGSFWLFCLAAFMGGAYAAVALSFRFAATDGVAKERRARALSLVMGGGVLAGVIGPMLVTSTMNFWPPHTFAITFIAQALVAAVSALVLLGVTSPEPVAHTQAGGRPLREIVRQPGFSRTVFSGAISYMVMNFLMTAAPLSMHMHGISQHASNLGIQWHVISMYAPGFFYRQINPPLRCQTYWRSGFSYHRVVSHGRVGRNRRHALLAFTDFTGHWLELWFYRRVGENHRLSPPGGKNAGAVV
ncbi:hypothetical protein OS42_11270 [Dickeya oryzae]